jgi:carboxyl-terminal processing protease
MDNDLMKAKTRSTVASRILPLLTGILIGAFMQNYILSDPFPSSKIPQDASSDFKLMAEAWNAIERYYVDRPSVQPRNMTYGAIAGMVDSLGDVGHSSFLSPEMVEVARSVATGKFTGIGAEIQMKNNRAIIVAPMDGSPAQKAGIKPGDIIVKVDGIDIAGSLLQETVRKILGPAGTKVTLTVEDPHTGELRTITIIRAIITLHSVTWCILPGSRIAQVRIAFFSNGTSEDLKKALDAIKQQKAQGIVLDLRNDPGGLLEMAVGVASQFLEKGTVLQERNARGEIQNIPVERIGKKLSLPLAVLVNGGTASASEIVAGALQDSKRAIIVGETTFGTGTVLQSIPLSDGSALLLAVREWLTPTGRIIWHRGIVPDVKVSLPPEARILVPEVVKDMSRAELRSNKDFQLLRALELLSQ